MPPELRSPRVALVHHRLVDALRGAAAVSVMTVCPLVALCSVEGWSQWIALAWGALGVVAFLLSGVLADPKGAACALRVAHGKVFVEALGPAGVFPADAVAEVRVVPRPYGAAGAVELVLRDGTLLRARTESLDEAHDWLDAGELALHRRVSRVLLGEAWHAWAFYVAYALMGVLAAPCLVAAALTLIEAVTGWGGIALFPAVVVPVWVALVLLAGRTSSPRRVDVGTDGVTIRRAFSREFLALERILHAGVGTPQAANSLRVGLRDGTWRDVPTTGSTRDHAATAKAAIEHSLARAARVAGANDLGLLERKGRPAGQWRAALESVFLSTSAFRGAALDREALLRVLDDAGAPPDRRVGAALALRGADDEARTRVRVAIDGCAHDETRDAMRAALDGTLDDAAMARLGASLAKP